MKNEGPIPLPSEFVGNPFAEATGPLWSLADRYADMAVLPSFSKSERSEPPVFRRMCCLRLLDAYFPHTRQVLFAERVQMMVLDGYRIRDPRKGLYQSHLAEAVERLEAGEIDYLSARDLQRMSTSSALLGPPGVGKTRTTRRALAAFGRTHRHVTSAGFMTQVSALQVECPAGRGAKQLCKNFFTQLDAMISGAGYMKRFGREKIPTETMLLHVQHLCQLHAIGVLVIDEIQNLLDASPNDKKELMKFIVLLINIVGIPVLLVGTCEAAEIFHAGLHAARRADGVGSDVWDPLPNDAAWRSWVAKLWRFQWTDVHTSLSDELADAMYDASQGIPDLAVKLYMLVQMGLISANEASPDGVQEVITPEVIGAIAANQFKMVAPMLAALRDNDHETLNKFRDISGFRASMDGIFADLAGMGTQDYERLRRRGETEADIAEDGKSYPQIRASLTALGLKNVTIDQIMVRAETEVPSGDMFAMVDVARTLASAEIEKQSVKAKRVSRPRLAPAAIDDPADVRNVLRSKDLGLQVSPA